MHRFFHVEITDLCNHDCLYCYKHGDNLSSAGFISPHSLMHIFDKISALEGRTGIILTGGEPFKNYAALKPVVQKYFLEKPANIDLSINTNLTMPSWQLEELTELAKSSGRSLRLLVSVPSLNSRVFAETVCADTFDQLFQNLRYIGRNSDFVECTANIVLTKLNYHNVFHTINTLAVMNVSNIKVTRAGAPYGQEGITPDIYVPVADLVPIYHRIMELSKSAGYRFRGSAVAFPLCEFPRMKEYGQLFQTLGSNCKAGENTFCIGVTGNIRPCPSMPSSYDEGNIFADDLAEVVNERFQLVRNLGPKENCASCDLFQENLCRGGCKYQMLAKKTIHKEESICPRSITPMNS